MAQNEPITMNLPAFFIIGAQKCGTSWLHRQLSSHPQVYLPGDKDHEYFSLIHANPDQAEQRWQQRFAAATPGQLVGDATASHFLTQLDKPWHLRPRDYNPALPCAVVDKLGRELKVIVLLRNPVERAVSAYLHHFGMGDLNLKHSILAAPDELGIISIGLYGQHLCNWLAVLDASNIYLETRSLKSDAAMILRDICCFLDIDGNHSFTNVQQPVFPGIQRVHDEQGIWVKRRRLGQAVQQLSQPLSVKNIAGEEYVRLIRAEELDKLHTLFAADQHLLQQLIADNPLHVGV